MISKKKNAIESRFSKINTDSRFSTVSNKNKKIKIDDRFAPMLTDKKFALVGMFRRRKK